MKKQKFNKKLSLNKETITNLNEIKGGGIRDAKSLPYPNGSACCATNTCSPTECFIQISQYQGESGCQAC